jgi:hypothetical protein
VQVDVLAMVGKVSSHASGAVAPGTNLSLQVQPDGTLAQQSGDLAIDTFTLSDEARSFGSRVTVHIERPDGATESVYLTRTYGHWEPVERHLIDPGADPPFVHFDGPASDPFPSGDTVVTGQPS